MKKIFIYYSLTGNGKMVANYLEDKDIETYQVITKKNLPRNMFLRILIGGYQAGRNKRAKLVDYDVDTSKYSEIIIGSPIWNDHLTPAINTILDSLDETKKISFILYSGSGEAPKTKKKLKDKYPDSIIIILKEPKKHGYELKKIDKLDK